jgi:hypothetical protein
MSSERACAYVLTLGKRHPRYAPSAYRTCITPTQAQTLFGSMSKPKPLGCGVFACVFQHPDPNKVVKITRDESDVAGLIQGQGAQVPKLYERFKLTSQTRWITPRERYHPKQEWPDQPEAYALVVEKLGVLTGSEKAKWDQRINRMQRFQDYIAHAATLPAGTVDPYAKTVTFNRQPTIGEMVKAICPKRPQREARTCNLRVRELNRIAADLQAKGVAWLDIHAGNIGVDKNGRWKALDLGASTTPLQTALPELAGARRRR